jgi:hypothetical protein
MTSLYHNQAQEEVIVAMISQKYKLILKEGMGNLTANHF